MQVLVYALAILSAVAAYNDPHYVPGHDGIVHLFEWKWPDIAKECENFLGPMGFGGVQVSDAENGGQIKDIDAGYLRYRAETKQLEKLLIIPENI